MAKVNQLIATIIVGLWSTVVLAQAHGSVPLEQAGNNLRDQASLQRGMAVYVHYCQGCHALQYARYNTVARDIGLLDDKGQVLDGVIKQHLNFISEKPTDNILGSLPKADGERWFGVAPPDLSLVSRVRGKDWIYTYMKSFYVDPSRPFGVNNRVFPDVAMPHVLLNLQGVQEPIWAEHVEGTAPMVLGMHVVKPGLLSELEYDHTVRDLVNFLEYIGEPAKLERERLGVWVLLFLVIFLVFTYLLKREYWKDVEK